MGKMDITLWMVIKNDEYYVDMALLSCLPFVKYVYVQDQGSTDNSTKVIADTINQFNSETKLPPVEYIIEIEDTQLKRFDPTYNEPKYRSLALQRAADLFQSKWLLQCDADDMFTPHFFAHAMALEQAGKDQHNSIRHASERFITPEYRAWDPNIHKVNGVEYIDPHTRLWKSSMGSRYVLNPAFKNTFLHCVLQPHPGPEYWLPGICNIHLHRTFGPKSWNFWEEGGDVFERKTPFNPKRQAPKWWNADVNMGKAVKIMDKEYVWPEFVLRKWREWMVYD